MSRWKVAIASIAAGLSLVALTGSALAWTAPAITPLCMQQEGQFRWTVTLSGTESSYDFQTSSDGVVWSADMHGVQGDNLVVTASATLWARWSADHSAMIGPVSNDVGACAPASPSPSPSDVTSGGGVSPSPSPASPSPEEASPSPSATVEASGVPGMSASPSPSGTDMTTGGGEGASASPTGQVEGITVTPPPTDSTGSSGSPMSPGAQIALMLLAASAVIGGLTFLAPARQRRR